MVQFTDWDILKNLLLAARWTILLSLLAFLGGGVFGLILTFLRSMRNTLITRLIQGYVEIFQGIPRAMGSLPYLRPYLFTNYASRYCSASHANVDSTYRRLLCTNCKRDSSGFSDWVC